MKDGAEIGMGERPLWLPIVRLARVRASSQAAEFPATNALTPDVHSEWRAAEPGAQLIEFRFHLARTIRRIRIVIVDGDQERTQDLSVAWTSRRGERSGVAVRQLFNFSPRGATRQVEEFAVDLPALSTIELRILPDIRGGPAVARVSEFALS